jgi:hypothetical protein
LLGKKRVELKVRLQILFIADQTPIRRSLGVGVVFLPKMNLRLPPLDRNQLA